MNAFDAPKNPFHVAKPHSAQKYTYGMPKEPGYYWFEYINDMGTIMPREPVEIYEDESDLVVVMSMLGTDNVLEESDLEAHYKKDPSGQPLFRFQKITQQGESGIMKKRKDEKKT